MTRSPVSVIILTLNEEANLPKCLESISGWADEVIVVDSFSTDKTLEIAEKYGAKVFKHEFENQAQQFNWALDNVLIKNDWIFRLDADEWLTPELKDEIAQALINADLTQKYVDINGFYIKRRVYFMGKWIRHGGYYPTWILRLFKKGRARSEEREMDEQIILLEGEVGRLKNDFVDENKKPLAEWITKHNDFSTREARERIKQISGTEQRVAGMSGQAKKKRWAKTRVYNHLPLFFRSFFYFVYRYFFRLGFLDGKPGLIFHFLQGFWHQFLIDAKIYEKLRHEEEK